MRIAVLTGGGVVPGLNPAIKAIVNRAVDNGYDVLGIRRGWMGLVQINPDDDETRKWVLPLDKEIVRRIDRTGGTSLIAAYRAGVDRALISEVPFDIQKLARMIVDHKHANPSNYAMLTVSEGAHPIEGEIVEGGQPDAFGHRELGGVYSDVPIPTLTQGKKRANVAELYDADCYRPHIRHVLGMPMFLT